MAGAGGFAKPRSKQQSAGLLLAAFGRPTCSNPTSSSTKKDPVSYTHLDVYKRQAVSNAARNVAEAILSNPHAKALEEAFGTRILPSLRNLVLDVYKRQTTCCAKLTLRQAMP